MSIGNIVSVLLSLLRLGSFLLGVFVTAVVGAGLKTAIHAPFPVYSNISELPPASFNHPVKISGEVLRSRGSCGLDWVYFQLDGGGPPFWINTLDQHAKGERLVCEVIALTLCYNDRDEGRRYYRETNPR